VRTRIIGFFVSKGNLNEIRRSILTSARLAMENWIPGYERILPEEG
jgi:hypothetical protein